MQADYHLLVRSHPSRGLLRELGLGIALLIGIVLSCVLLPDMPGDAGAQAVSMAPPTPIESAPRVVSLSQSGFSSGKP